MKPRISLKKYGRGIMNRLEPEEVYKVVAMSMLIVVNIASTVAGLKTGVYSTLSFVSNLTIVSYCGNELYYWWKGLK